MTAATQAENVQEGELFWHSMTEVDTARALTIAGSDSGGGAGIQADLKAFARCGVHGMTAITAITAQNTVAVEAIFELPADLIVAQVKAVVEDIGVDAVKIGMLGSVATIKAVSKALELLPRVPVVIDPVMVAESGARLIESEAVQALIEILLPRATVITPNLEEAAVLLGQAQVDCEKIGRELLKLGPSCVVVTGGHRSEGADDFFIDSSHSEWIRGQRYGSGAAHGSGCTHSSALAAHLALGSDPVAAARAAKEIASEAVKNGLADIGKGPGPVDVFSTSERRSSGSPA